MNEVMRNAKTFLELIQAAKTEKAGCWNKEALQRAMQWAQYFEGVYQKLYTKPGVVTQFNRGLAIINSQPGAAPGPSPISFEQLKNSQKLVLKIMLQNPYLSGELYSLVLDQYSQLPEDEDAVSGRSKLEEDATECAHMKAVRNVLINIKKLTSEAVAKTNPSKEEYAEYSLCNLQDVDTQTDAVLLHQHLVHHLKKDPSSDGIQDYLNTRLHQIALKQHGLDILSRVASGQDFYSPESSDDKQASVRCRDFVKQWLQENRMKYEHKARIDR